MYKQTTWKYWTSNDTSTYEQTKDLRTNWYNPCENCSNRQTNEWGIKICFCILPTFFNPIR